MYMQYQTIIVDCGQRGLTVAVESLWLAPAHGSGWGSGWALEARWVRASAVRRHSAVRTGRPHWHWQTGQTGLSGQHRVRLGHRIRFSRSQAHCECAYPQRHPCWRADSQSL